MKKGLLVGWLFMGVWDLGAQDFNVDRIPDSLKANANMVKRLEDYRVIIRSLDKVIIKRHYAITILNEKGDDYAEYTNNYSSWEGLSDITGNLYDATGKKIKTVKRKDISDVSLSDGMSLMVDDRIKKHNFYHRQYPYTIEYEDEQQLRGTFFLPAWYPVEDDEYSVEQSRYTIETPAGYKLRYKQLNFTTAPVITQNGSATVYTWELKKFAAIPYEDFRPPFTSLVPVVYIGPDDFSFGGYSGNMRSWLDFGKFNVTLNKDRDILPDNIKQEVHRLVDGVSGREQKISMLYEYLQKNTRYISIQLGIGGWQPFDAKYVATNKYGDCKALSNYMVSLLKEAGIKAHYVLISAGDRYKALQEDFPASNFNHIVTCVPNGKDSIWLECTNQTVSAGYMGSFTGGRKALLIDDDGGHIVRTPGYQADDNLQLRSIKASIDTEGNLLADINTHSTGEQQELQHDLIHEATKEQRDKYLNNTLRLPTYEVRKSDYRQIKGRIPVIDEYLQVTAPGYATVSGKRLFVQPNLFSKSRTRLSEEVTRKYPIVFLSAYKDVDTIQIALPPGYTVESLPKDIKLDSQFGQYSISYKVSDNTINVLRLKISHPNSFPAEKYTELVKYYEAIFKADHSRIVLVKKES
jgi:hypothetical protein